MWIFSRAKEIYDERKNEKLNEGRNIEKETERKLEDRQIILSFENIELYEKPDGTCPVLDMLSAINGENAHNKTIQNISKLNLLGRNAREPLVTYVEDGISELRTKANDGLTRIFYFFPYGNSIVLTNGYVKQKQELNRDELQKAKYYRDEYMNKSTKDNR